MKSCLYNLLYIKQNKHNEWFIQSLIFHLDKLSRCSSSQALFLGRNGSLFQKKDSQILNQIDFLFYSASKYPNYQYNQKPNPRGKSVMSRRNSNRLDLNNVTPFLKLIFEPSFLFAHLYLVATLFQLPHFLYFLSIVLKAQQAYILQL